MTESHHESKWIDCGVTETHIAELRKTAPDLGALVETVRHGDRLAAVDALFLLKNDICHQGMAVADTTPIVLPYLISLLSCRDLPARVELIRLVRQIARASTAWRRVADDVRTTRPENYREQVKWEIAVDRILDEARSLFETLQQDPDVEISRCAEELATGSR